MHPEEKRNTRFFSKIKWNNKTSRTVISFIDESGQIWKFNFVYYNNKFFGGTRNEYRLTGMTDFIRVKNLKKGDVIVLSINDKGDYFMGVDKPRNTEKLIFSNKWKIVNI